MYVALKTLQTVEGTRKPGDEMPEVNEWRPQVTQAHINMKAIEWRGDGDAPHRGPAPAFNYTHANKPKEFTKKPKGKKNKGS